VIDAHELSKLRWRCRRGMLENDLFLERFFGRHGDTLTRANAAALESLMDLSDNDLLDLFLSRTEPQGALDRAEVHRVLALIRTGAARNDPIRLPKEPA
jgi:antitoxin CptB